jgi:hypothetical protein
LLIVGQLSGVRNCPCALTSRRAKARQRGCQRALFPEQGKNLFLILNNGVKAALIFQDRRLVFLNGFLIGFYGDLIGDDRFLILENLLLIGDDVSFRHSVRILRLLNWTLRGHTRWALSPWPEYMLSCTGDSVNDMFVSGDLICAYKAAPKNIRAEGTSDFAAILFA